MGSIVPNLGLISVVGIMEPGRISIADALFTKAQQRVLALLYGKPERSFYLNEIVRLAGMGRGAIARELEKLSLASLITVTPQGNQTHYQANRGNPVFDELRGIVIKTFGITDVLKEALNPLLSKAEPQLVFIYGSIAKGEEHAESDIDVMIVADGVTYSDVMALLEPAERELKRIINPTIYSFDEFKKRRESDQSFIKRVLEQPKIDLT